MSIERGYFMADQKLNKNKEQNTFKALVTTETKDDKNFITHHGKGTKAFTMARDKRKKINEPSQIAMYFIEENNEETTEIFIKKFDELRGSLGVNTDKLLTALTSKFTEINNHKDNNPDNLKIEIYLPFTEYGLLVGKDFIEKETETPEEARKERARISEAKKDFRNQLKKDLEILKHAEIKFKETFTVKGKHEPEHFDMSILGSNSVSVKSDVIYVALDKAFCRYLKKTPLTTLPKILWRIDGRQQNLWSLGVNMATHYSRANNQKQGTYNRLRVETLLKYSGLEKYEEIKRTKSWIDRLKNRLEGYLEQLKSTGFLVSWEYRLTNGELVPDDEVEHYCLTSYHTWKELRVHYDVLDSEFYQEQLKLGN